VNSLVDNSEKRPSPAVFGSKFKEGVAVDVESGEGSDPVCRELVVGEE
jgi:hypothetical protein